MVDLQFSIFNSKHSILVVVDQFIKIMYFVVYNKMITKEEIIKINSNKTYLIYRQLNDILSEQGLQFIFNI